MVDWLIGKKEIESWEPDYALVGGIIFSRSSIKAGI
jgi:hypothetical protein